MGKYEVMGEQHATLHAAVEAYANARRCYGQVVADAQSADEVIEAYHGGVCDHDVEPSSADGYSQCRTCGMDVHVGQGYLSPLALQTTMHHTNRGGR